jgi:hypothetical protein
MKMNQNDKDLIADGEKYRRTERERERERQIKYQESLGPVKTARERELEALDRWEGYYRNTTRNTY